MTKVTNRQQRLVQPPPERIIPPSAGHTPTSVEEELRQGGHVVTGLRRLELDRDRGPPLGSAWGRHGRAGQGPAIAP